MTARGRRGLVELAAVALGACGGGSPASPDAAGPDAPALDAPTGPDAPEPFDLLIESDVLDLGYGCVGMLGEPVELSMANPSGTATPPIRASVTGPDAASFEIVSSTCEDGVPPRAFCFMQMAIAASAGTFLEAALELRAGDRLFTVALEGRGASCDPGPRMVPTSFDFGAVPLGATSSPATFTLFHGGSEESDILSASISGAPGSAFAIVPGSDGCSRRTLGGGARCTIQVTSSPPGRGAYVAELRLQGPSPGGAAAALTGTTAD